MCTYNIQVYMYVNSINECLHHYVFFHKLPQCNEHVEMNKPLCGLACTWMTIIDSQFYIIDS